jgi:hypothetical protein
MPNAKHLSSTPRTPGRARVSAACKRHLALVEARLATMTDAQLFQAAEQARRDLGW